MSKFLKLTRFAINTTFITRIDVNKSSFNIHVCNPEINGLQIFYYGWIKTDTYNYSINEEQHPEDYKIVKKWFEE